jgi:hypothetical protein
MKGAVFKMQPDGRTPATGVPYRMRKGGNAHGAQLNAPDSIQELWLPELPKFRFHRSQRLLTFWRTLPRNGSWCFTSFIG